jgi:hypothetical protein
MFLKHYKHFIVLIGIFIIFIAGCSNGIENEMNGVIVQKRVGEENKYEHFREITDDNAVRKIGIIIDGISWKNAEAKWASPPHYKFHFEGKNEQSESKKLIYFLWISPNKDRVHLIVEGESKLAQLSEIDSAELFETLTGGKLTDEN